MDLIPESIKGTNTLRLDQTFLERLKNMGVKQLAIDFENENDMTKLSLWLEQFGIPTELLPENLDGFTLRDLLPLTIKIYNLSGTDSSIRLLAQALGASEITIHRNCFTLSYDHQARHDGLFRHDNGQEYQAFAVDLEIAGISQNRVADYEVAFRKLFNIFQPIHLYLRHIIFQ